MVVADGRDRGSCMMGQDSAEVPPSSILAEIASGLTRIWPP